MTWTYAELQTEVAEAAGDPTGGNTLSLARGAIRKAIIELNDFSWPFNFEPDEQITLVAGQVEYTLAHSPFQRFDTVWYLNAAGDDVESPVLTFPLASFVEAGFYTSNDTGRPDVVTYNEETGKLRLNRIPTASENGRKISVAYYYEIANPPTTVNDKCGALVVECATWRIRRQVPGYDWVTDKRNAEMEKLRARGPKRMIGRFASGHR